MNDARALYLASYGIIDNVDKLVKFSRMQYCSWKYWHAAMLHAKAMVGIIAYDMYMECCEGKLDPSWKIKKPLTFWQFRDRLGQQMLTYDPRFRHYPGDERMRLYTAMNKDQCMKKDRSSPTNSQDQPQKKRKTRQSPTQALEPEDDSSDSESEGVVITTEEKVTIQQLKQLKKKKNYRLCGCLLDLSSHIHQVKKIKCAKQCEVCGVDTYTVCALCPGNPGIHFFPTKGVAKGKDCFVSFHSDHFFGLAKSDICMFEGFRKKDWKPPTNRQVKANAKHIQALTKELW